MKVTAIVLAAGKGTRMKSERPKVLHPLCGQPMVDYVIDAALTAGARDVVVVVGHGRDEVTAHLGARWGERVRTAVQEEQRGTGHAVQCGLSAVDDADVALLLYGDTPLVEAEDLRALLEATGEGCLGLLTTRVGDPTGYGRIVRSDGQVTRIVEHRDCDEAQRAIDEINPGMYAVALPFLREALEALTPDNDQGELYLTDVVAMAAQREPVVDRHADAGTLVGVNDRAQLAAVEATLFERIADHWRRAGATVRPGARIDASVTIELDAVIEAGAHLRGRTVIRRGARVDVGCVVDDGEIGPGAWLKPYVVVQSSVVGELAQAGPFAHLRPGSQLDEEAKVGNFVETKKTRLRRGAKASHLAYLGDGDVGEQANIGAGTIFCNYDGFQKHRTVVEAGAFIGSDSQLVAPVTIGANAYVGTGTTVTRDVPADALAIGRARQDNKEGYAPRIRGRMKAAAEAAKKRSSG